jgi:hypothetical protein
MSYFDTYNSSNLYNYGSSDYDYRDYGDTKYGLVDYDVVPKTQYTQYFQPKTEQSKFDYPGLFYGGGALLEGISNLVRGIRGDDVPPSRMAGQALERYMKKDEPDYLTALLSKLVNERGIQKNSIFGRLDLQPSSGKSIFGDIFA